MNRDQVVKALDEIGDWLLHHGGDPAEDEGLAELLGKVIPAARQAALSAATEGERVPAFYGIVSLDEPEAGPMALFDVRHLAETWREQHLPAESCIPTEDTEIRHFALTLRPATAAEVEALDALQPDGGDVAPAPKPKPKRKSARRKP